MSEPTIDVDASFLSEATLLVVAYEWDVLTKFAETTPALVLPGESARWEAGRYIRYDSALTHKEWWQVEAFVESESADLGRPDIEAVVATCSGGVYSSGDGVRFDADGVAQLWRLLFGFAAQYSRYAERLTGEYLRRSRSMTETEWNAVDALLSAWETETSENERN